MMLVSWFFRLLQTDRKWAEFQYDLNLPHCESAKKTFLWQSLNSHGTRRLNSPVESPRYEVAKTFYYGFIMVYVFDAYRIKLTCLVLRECPSPVPMLTSSLESSFDKKFNLNYSSMLSKNDRKVSVLVSFTFSPDPKLYPSKLETFEFIMNHEA